MPTFSAASQAILSTCESRLVQVFTEAVKVYDCRALAGARSAAEEMDNIRAGRSHLKDPLNSSHVVSLEKPKSRALDIAPYPVVWPTAEMSRPQYVHAIGRFYHFAGFIKAIAGNMGIGIRWGGDWDSDLDFSDQTFDDLDHFELVE